MKLENIVMLKSFLHVVFFKESTTIYILSLSELCTKILSHNSESCEMRRIPCLSEEISVAQEPLQQK